MAGPADASPAGDVPQPRRRWRRALAETAIMILVAVLLAGLVRAFVFQTFWIPTPTSAGSDPDRIRRPGFITGLCRE